MPKLYVDVANCPIAGEGTTTLSTGGWRRDRIDLMQTPMPVTIRQTAAGMPGKHRYIKGQTVHTTTIELEDVSSANRSFSENVANELVWLLSFATMSPVRPLAYRRGTNGHYLRTSQKTDIYRPTIESNDGVVVRSFLESTWKRFRRLKRKRRLDRIIDYMVLADGPDQPIEVSTLLLFTALESLKATHSPGVRGMFERRVQAMIAAVDMKRGMRQLVALRNRLIHEGIAPMSHSSLIAHHDRLHDILREYLCRLLGYKGEILIYASGSRAVKVL